MRDNETYEAITELVKALDESVEQLNDVDVEADRVDTNVVHSNEEVDGYNLIAQRSNTQAGVQYEILVQEEVEEERTQLQNVESEEEGE